jgi:phage regulator Rha-like protein
LPQLIEGHNIQIKTGNVMRDAINIQEDANKRHKEVLELIETLSDTSSDGASTVWKCYSSLKAN